MAQQGDFKGLKFNKLTITGDAPSKRTPNGGLERRVIAECDCGNSKEIAWKSIKRGKIKSCGCLTPEKIDIIKNNTYGYWTILNEVAPYITSDGSKVRKVLVKCICEATKERTLNSLRQGDSTSCGCMTEQKTGYYNVSVDSPIAKINLEKINKRKMGHWKIIEEISAKRNENREIIRIVKFQCKCGYIKETKLDNIKDSKQCSKCANEERRNKVSEEEKALRKKLKGVYGGIKNRCQNLNSKDYKNYGGRGIKIEESFNTFDKIYDWAISQGYTLDCKLEFDRIDNNGNYSVENCRLLSKAENNRNMRRNVITWEIVNEIRYGKYVGMSNKYIAEDIGCSEATITSVKNNKTWKMDS